MLIEDGWQNERASGQQIKGQLHGAVFFTGTAPDGDERVHGKEGDIVPDKDEEEIHAHENAEDSCHQQEGESEELLNPGLQLPHGEHPGKEDDTGEHEHGQVKTVRRIEVVDAHGLDPEHLLHELETSLGFVVREEKIDGEHHGDP